MILSPGLTKGKPPIDTRRASRLHEFREQACGVNFICPLQLDNHNPPIMMRSKLRALPTSSLRQAPMSKVNRRECFKAMLGGLLQTAGTVVLASVVMPAAVAQAKPVHASEEPAKDLQQRADQLAGGQTAAAGGDEDEFAKFVNGGFRNAAFRNTSGGGGGAFRNAGFANGGGGGAFRNGGFANGGWRN
jgi:hypothetical protein